MRINWQLLNIPRKQMKAGSNETLLLQGFLPLNHLSEMNSFPLSKSVHSCIKNAGIKTPVPFGKVKLPTEHSFVVRPNVSAAGVNNRIDSLINASAYVKLFSSSIVKFSKSVIFSLISWGAFSCISGNWKINQYNKKAFNQSIQSQFIFINTSSKSLRLFIAAIDCIITFLWH